MNELSAIIKEITGSKVEAAYSQARVGDIRDSVAEVKRAKEIGFQPEYALEEGLRGMIEYSSNKIKPAVV